MTNYYISEGADDYDDASAVATTITIFDTLMVDPELVQHGYLDIDTSGIADTATVTSAKLYWYDHSYTTGGVPAPSKQWVIYVWNTTTTVWDTLTSGTHSANGWKNYTFTSAQLARINKTGDTKFMLQTPAPEAGQSRTWKVRAYEYDVNHTYRAYLVITTGTGQVFVLTS